MLKYKFDALSYCRRNLGRYKMANGDDPMALIAGEIEALLARHNTLVEAVAWERECEDVAHWRYEVWEMAEVGSGDCEIYTVAQCIHDEARSEVERLIANEGAANCKGEK